jgi:hypothetical protein
MFCGEERCDKRGGLEGRNSEILNGAVAWKPLNFATRREMGPTVAERSLPVSCKD